MQLWRNWHTRKTKDLVSLARTGSSPVNCIFLMHIIRKNKIEYAVVAELAYAHDSGSCPCTWVGVQVPSTALLGRGERIAFRKKSSPLFLCLQLCLKESTNLIPYLLLEEMDICMICIFNGKQRHITACLFKLIVKFFSLSKRHSMIIISMNN